jgi:hypothetical protein
MDVAVRDSAAAERTALRQRRDRLTARSAVLFAEAERLAVSNDREALRMLSGQLHEHSADLVAYHHALELFHVRLDSLR